MQKELEQKTSKMIHNHFALSFHRALRQCVCPVPMQRLQNIWWWEGTMSLGRSGVMGSPWKKSPSSSTLPQWRRRSNIFVLNWKANWKSGGVQSTVFLLHIVMHYSNILSLMLAVYEAGHFIHEYLNYDIVTQTDTYSFYPKREFQVSDICNAYLTSRLYHN